MPETTYQQFKTLLKEVRANIYRDILAANRDSVRIKKRDTAVKNLAKIFGATLKISNRKGFQAMTMRELSRASGLSMGAIYAYLPGKNAILDMLRRQLEKIIQDVFAMALSDDMNPRQKLRSAMETHVYLTEAMGDWFYFFYMESKNLNQGERAKAIQAELGTESIFIDILREGSRQGCFLARDPHLTAGVIKAVLQDWYLKRWKHSRRSVSVDAYADFACGFVEAFLLPPDGA